MVLYHSSCDDGWKCQQMRQKSQANANQCGANEKERERKEILNKKPIAKWLNKLKIITNSFCLCHTISTAEQIDMTWRIESI